jgi:DNA-binding Xre family transcriptional regulator
MEMSSQRLYEIFKADNLTLEVIVKFAITLNCKLDELVEYGVE